MNTKRTGAIAAMLVAIGFVAGRYGSPVSPRAALPGPPTAASARAEPTDVAAAEMGRPRGQSLREESCKQAALRLSTTPASGAAFEQLLRALRGWATVNPPAALAYARAHLALQRQNQAVTEILGDWAKADSSAAWSWATKNVPENGSHLDVVLSHIGEVNGPAAWNCATEFAQSHPSSAQSTYASALRGITQAGDFPLAVRLLNQTESLTSSVRDSLATLVATEWGRYEPDKAVAWASGLPAESVSRERALINVVQAWAEVDPAAAARYATQLPPGSARQQAVTQALPNWASTDPAAAAQWLFSQEPSRDFDQAIYALSTHPQVMADFSSAVTLAGAIHDPEIRTQSLTRIVAGLQQRDAAAASRFLQSSPEIPAEMRSAVRLRLAANDIYSPDSNAFSR